MAQQITNTFLKSKMNKDLDDRILPNGEYRDARNISVGRSEDNDVGALENIIGNNLVTGTNIGDGLTIIGIHSNNTTDQIFVFLTDYTDLNPFQPTDAPSTSKHYIYLYNNSTGTYTPLVVGTFLNFSTTRGKNANAPIVPNVSMGLMNYPLMGPSRIRLRVNLT